MVDRTQALKWEDPTHGGTETDLSPSEIDVHEDFLDCRGVAIQSDISNDAQVLVTRDADDNLTFQDVAVPEPMTLKELAHGGTGLAYMREWVYADEVAWVRIPYQFIIADQLTLEGELRVEGRVFIL
jgi:hypothetical protein